MIYFIFFGGGVIWPLNEHENNVSKQIYMSSKKYEANGYEHDLDLIITLHQLCISYPYTRSGCIWRNIQITQVYLTYNQHEYKGGCRLGPNTKETLKSRLHSFCALQPYCRGVVGFLQGREAV